MGPNQEQTPSLDTLPDPLKLKLFKMLFFFNYLDPEFYIFFTCGICFFSMV